MDKKNPETKISQNQSASSYNNTAIHLFQLGRFEESLFYIDKAVSIDGATPLLCNKVIILEALKRYDESNELIDIISVLDPTGYELYRYDLNFIKPDQDSSLKLPDNLGYGSSRKHGEKDSLHDKIEYGDYVCENYDE